MIKLSDYENKPITEICQNFTDTHFNMCAHFVSHVLGLGFGYTCRVQSGHTVSPGANLRVQEVFAQCPEVGEWDAKSTAATDSGLIFVTTKMNKVDLSTKYFNNIPKKHVGIYIGDAVFHFSNSEKKVLMQDTQTFLTHVKHHYSAIKAFYGTFPEKSNEVGL
ncbi:MAG TPA: hypothetical protein VGL34_01845 [Steroidobacteraceae bacterium]|jgi:hypothetical protein